MYHILRYFQSSLRGEIQSADYSPSQTETQSRRLVTALNWLFPYIFASIAYLNYFTDVSELHIGITIMKV